MVSCVAFVEVQLSVDESPLSMEDGSAESVTVGCAGAGADAGAGGGVVATGFFLQPPVKMVATRPATNKERYNGRETTVIPILLRPTFKIFPSSTHRGQYRNTGGLVPGDISYHDILYMAHI